MKISIVTVAIFTITLLALPQIATALGASTKITVGRNLVVTKDPRNQPQVEPFIALDPRNPDIIVAGANDMRLFEGSFLPTGWAGVYRSTDGGRTWTNRLIPGFPGDNSPQGLASPLRGFGFFFDAVVAFDSKGNLYYAGIVLNTAPGVGIKDGTLFLAKFTDDGATLSFIKIVRQGSGQTPFIDKPWLFVDQSNDNVYLTWTEFVGFAQTMLMFTRSTDGGQSFSEPITLSGPLKAAQGSPASGQCSWLGAHGGSIYAVWISYTTPTGQLLLVRSKDGGTTFTAPSAVAASPFAFFTSDQIFRTPCGASVVTDDTGSKVFVAWTDWSSPKLDILFIVSTDRGDHFTPPQRLNEVAASHAFYAMADFSNGRLNVAWYDARFSDPGPIDKLDVFYATSSDFGQTFSPNIRVTSVSFNPSLPIYLGGTAAFVGDYFGLDSQGGVVQIAWADNRNVNSAAGFDTGARNSDIFTARTTVS